MKNFLIMLCVIFLTLPVFAEYKPIPPERSAEYKAEIEDIIDKETPKVKNDMDNVVISYNNEKDESIKYTIRSIGLDSTLFNLFYKMIDITDKYVPIKKDITPTGSYYVLEDILYPYFIDNHITITKLIELQHYRDTKQKQIGEFP